jgi:predicted MPP superfamily phosphohydrolase
LTLAGQLHGGQVRLPFFGAVIVPSSYGNKYSQGLIEEDNKKMIVTRGIGTSILPVRFNCPPEIDVIEFTN